MVGAVIIGTVTDHHGQFIGIMIGPYKMITGRLGCTIRGVRIVFGVFREEAGIAQRPIHFIG